MRISSDVGRALETLEKAISVVREYSSSLTRSSSSKTNEETPNLDKDVEIDPTHLEDSGVCPKAGVSAEVSAEVSDKGRPVERNSHESRNSSSNLDIRYLCLHISVLIIVMNLRETTNYYFYSSRIMPLLV
jgi:hypothetical protein